LWTITKAYLKILHVLVAPCWAYPYYN
jgi:hypothetical protein